MNVGYTIELENQKKNTKIDIPETRISPSESTQDTRLDKYCIFHVEGGLGKNVAATAIVSLIKQQYANRKLIVVASYPEIFLNNPNIYRVYAIGRTSYFYDDYIHNKDSIIFRHEPYFHTSHILKEKSLIHTWADMYGLPYNQSSRPELFMNLIQNDSSIMWQRQKPIMVLQTNGGPMFNQPRNYSWTRDIPYQISVEIVNEYKQQYHIIQICNDESQRINEVECISQTMSAMELFSLLRVSKKRVLIDSCLQHAAAALDLKSTVLWIGTSPKVFGYDMHTNVIATPPTGVTKLIDSYLFDYQFTGELHECPYFSVDDMFRIEDILTSISNT